MNGEASESIEIIPALRPIDADVTIPGSKSITNRALMVAALARGESQLSGALFSDDTQYMAQALDNLGLTVESYPAENAFRVVGGDGTFPVCSADLFVGNAGTAMRFLTAALPLGSGSFRIDGVPRMRTRPIEPLLEAMRALGANAHSIEGTGCPPIQVISHGLKGGKVRISGEQSSQYFSALLMVAPYASKGVEINVLGDLVSKPYMPMTAAVMEAFGVHAEIDSRTWMSFSVSPNQRYEGRAHKIEPDASNASYFFAAAAVTGGRVRINNLGRSSTQGDLEFVSVLESMGAKVTRGETFTEVVGPRNGKLSGVDLDLNAISDTAQTLAAISPFADGPVTIRGIAHARLKETDRVSAMAIELRRLGQIVEEREDGITVIPMPVNPARVATYDDHRMAMSFAITGLRAPGVTILDPGCVNKTFPEFFDRLRLVTGG